MSRKTKKSNEILGRKAFTELVFHRERKKSNTKLKLLNVKA